MAGPTYKLNVCTRGIKVYSIVFFLWARILTAAANINKSAAKDREQKNNCTHKPLCNSIKDS